jgi:beta-N-acetylhexosaminidase
MRGAPRAADLGLLLVLKLEESRWTASLQRLLQCIRPAGVLLPARDLPDAGATAGFLARLGRALESGPILALEEEGGAHDPLRGFLPPLPSARSAAQMGESGVRCLGELIGLALKLEGFNTCFAPVLDLSTNRSERILGARTFAADASEVTRYAGAFLRGLQRHGIMACGKHFPGLGGDEAEQSYPEIIGKPMGDLWREDLLPYRRLLPHLPLILVSQAAYKAYDYDLPQPAAFSERVVQGLLHSKLSYGGLAIADVSGAPSAETSECAARAVKAGCNLVVVGAGNSAEAARERLKKALESGMLASQRLERSLKKIAEARKGLRAPPGKVSHSAVEQLARRIEGFGKEAAGGTRAD